MITRIKLLLGGLLLLSSSWVLAQKRPVMTADTTWKSRLAAGEYGMSYRPDGTLYILRKNAPAEPFTLNLGRVAGLNQALSTKAESLTTTQQLAKRIAVAKVTEVRSMTGASGHVLEVPDAGIRGGLFRWDSLDSTSPDDSTLTLVTAAGKRLKRIGPDNQFVASDWGLAGDATTNDVAKLMRFIRKASARSRKSTFDLEGKTYKLNSGITGNFAKIKFNAGNGGCFDFSGMTSGTAIQYSGAGTGLPWQQSASGLDDLEIIGPGKSLTAVKGIVFVTPTSDGYTSHFAFDRLNVHGFSTAVIVDKNAYILKFYTPALWDNGTCLDIRNADNSGESITVFGGTMHGSDTAVVLRNPNAEVTLTGGSSDYVKYHAVVTGGQLFLTDWHAEGENYASAPFVAAGDGSSIHYESGRMANRANTVTPVYAFSAATAAGVGGIWLSDHVVLNNVQTSSDYLGGGGGDFHDLHISAYATELGAKMSSKEQTLAVDGEFEATTILDNVVALGYDGTRGRTSASNVTLSTSTDWAYSGSRSLKFDNAAGSGFQLVFPIRAEAQVALLGRFHKPSAGGGAIYVTYSYGAGLSYDANRLPQFALTQDLGTQALTLTGGTVADIALAAAPARAAAKYTHFIVTFSGGANAGVSYVDNLVVNQH